MASRSLLLARSAVAATATATAAAAVRPGASAAGARAAASSSSSLRGLSTSTRSSPSPLPRLTKATRREQRRSLATLQSTLNAPQLGSSEVAASLFAPLDAFEHRHLGPRVPHVQQMLSALGYSDMDSFIADAVPKSIRLDQSTVNTSALQPLSESELLRRGTEIASANKKFKSLIGMGYHNTLVPNVILRNILENPAWYTSYTPYQPEIAQGRLESLLNYQTLITSLTGLDVANASLLDEGTAAAEAMVLAYGTSGSKRKTFLVDRAVLPQTIAVLRQRAKGFGIRVLVTDLRTPHGYRLPSEEEAPRDDIIGALVQYPDVNGRIVDWAGLAKDIHSFGGLVIAATDLLALTMIKPPAEWGADIALGNSARFGVPPGFGGPHAAFFAVTDKLKRRIPGRLVGVSRDSSGKVAYRLALQTREQHIRREKATSNICTAQALLANMSAMYAVYHGPEGLRRIAAKVHGLTRLLKHELTEIGARVVNRDGAFFDTLTIDLSKAGVGSVRVHAEAEKAGLNFRRISDTSVGLTLDETVTIEEVADILNVFKAAFAPTNTAVASAQAQAAAEGIQLEQVYYRPDQLLELASSLGLDASTLNALEVSTPVKRQPVAPASASPLPSTSPAAIQAATPVADLPPVPDFKRTTSTLTHPVFSAHRSETEMLRYIHHLQSKDLSLAQAMIPLGSCTMKLNATSSMTLLSRPEYGSLHPFAPAEQATGYDVLIRELERDLCTITGFPAVSLQPNSGAQGEFAGLSVIRAYLDSKGEGKRDVCLIPQSAHGTNPASAVMAGMRVVSVKALADGSLDLEDLRAKADKHRAELAAFMVTYPSTYGVFEEKVQEACSIIHEAGGQVYMDGANLQAQVGLTNPAIIGADVTHLNLHKTFSIPHGGGGPGVGPICCAEHLAPYLPGHPLASVGGEQAIDPISAAPFGSASILTIAWAYIKQLGWQGLKASTEVALLNANYIAWRLKDHYKVKYTNSAGLVAHELLIDLAEYTEAGLTVMDFAKRLIDYGFHPPTCAWPISTGLLIEPSESESLAEIERFCEAMLAIKAEADEVRSGKAPKDKNLLKRAPHTIEVMTRPEEEWDVPYSRARAAYPVKSLRANKFWPAVGRLDEVHGDKNLFCTCPSVDELAE
ncbi:glycine decarboxylase subunit P [Tilletia horrida]|nr:glycine decarboxylase subunit P [Tilletia horrida]